MPELPEVETVRKGLEAQIMGFQILKVEVFREKTLSGIQSPDFQELLIGETFARFERKAKHLLLVMRSGKVLVAHLKMTGNFRVQPLAEAYPKHAHLVFDLDHGQKLLFCDQRGFGKIAMCMNYEEAIQHGGIARLAPEPLSEAFTFDYFCAGLFGHKTRLKPLLLDQYRVVSGLGNIYTDEALFQSGILPTRSADRLTRTESKRLYIAIQKVIEDSIEAGGSSIRNYVQHSGEPGKYALNLYVYGRKSQKCRVCETPITYIRLAQRGTHFCPSCQT